MKPNIEGTAMVRIGRNAVGVAVIAVGIVLHGCAKTHSPQNSTETGNPPVIDADRVALIVQDDVVHVVGEKSAVDPGGVTIRVKNLVSDKSASGRAANDGSFDVKAPGSANDGFSVQSSNGNGDSKAVFVTEGGAAAAEGENGTLSCDQQNQLAAEQLHAVVDSADDTCTQASDCIAAGIGSVCTDGCGGGFVSKAGLAELEDAVSAVEHGLCADFRKQGCSYTAVGCVPPPEPMCLNGHCRLHTEPSDAGDASSDVTDAGASTCSGRSQTAMMQLQQAIADADKTCTSDDDCVHAPSSTDCFEDCDLGIVSLDGRTQVQTAIDAINAGVCARYSARCTFAIPMCAQPPKALCNQGQCGTADATMCGQKATAAQQQFDQAKAAVVDNCTQNSDCYYAPSPTCINPGCEITGVSKSSADQVHAIVDQINQDVCAPAEAAGCSYATTGPACSPPALRCTGGRCQ
jgi:hypothetical protein